MNVFILLGIGFAFGSFLEGCAAYQVWSEEVREGGDWMAWGALFFMVFFSTILAGLSVMFFSGIIGDV